MLSHADADAADVQGSLSQPGGAYVILRPFTEPQCVQCGAAAAGSTSASEATAGASCECRLERELWALDPLFSVPVKIVAAQLAALPDATANGTVCWLGPNHPVRSVDVVGVVISVDPRQPLLSDSKVKFTLDDSTGLIECVQWLNGIGGSDRRALLARHQMGAVLHVQGRLGRFRQVRQVTVDRAWAEDDLLAEALHWSQARTLWKDCYSRPFERPPAHVVDGGGAEADAICEDTGSCCTAGDTSARAAAPAQAPVSSQLKQMVLDVLCEARRPGGANGLSVAEVISELPRRAGVCPPATVAAVPAAAHVGHGAAPAQSVKAPLVREVERALEGLVDEGAIYVVDSDARGRSLYRAL